MILMIRAFMVALLAGTLLLVAPLAQAGPVNVNTADAETIAAELKGIGLTKARAIVAYRNANGRFGGLEDLKAVTGIGERTLAQNAAYIRFGDDKTDDGKGSKKPAPKPGSKPGSKLDNPLVSQSDSGLASRVVDMT